MTTLLASAPAVEIEIKGALYAVEPIPAGFAGVSAVRVTKLASGESYDVVLTEDGRAECDCPSYEFTYRGTAGTCKHGQALLAQGLLVAPISGGSPAAEAPPAVVRPWTDVERKRAAYFHLSAPKPAPALEAAPEIPAANPRDSWPAWTEADRWTIADEGPADVAPAPSWDSPRYEPESIEAAWWAGFQLGQEGEYPAPPKTMAERDRYFFQCGRIAGFMESEDGRAYRADMEACRDRAFAEFDAYRDSEPSEVDGFAPGYYS